jgi:hypothetical protein
MLKGECVLLVYMCINVQFPNHICLNMHWEYYLGSVALLKAFKVLLSFLKIFIKMLICT